jgi:hypothetical protein
VSAAISVIVAEVVTYRDSIKREREREIKQTERDHDLTGKIIEALRQPPVEHSPPLPSPVVSAGTIGTDDPLVYLSDIQEVGDNFIFKTSFVLENKGRSVAHRVQIYPLEFGYTKATFKPIDYLAPNTPQGCEPTIHGDSSMGRHLLRDALTEAVNHARNPEGQFDGKLNFPVTISYFNPAEDAEFTRRINVTFSYVDMLLNDKHLWPNSDLKFFEFSHEPPVKKPVTRLS